MANIRFGHIRASVAEPSRQLAIEARPDAIIQASCTFAPEGDHDSAWQDMLAHEDIDAIVLDAGHAQAPDIIVRALEQGLHVLADNPPGTALEDIINIRRAETSARGKVLKFSLNHRYHGSVMAAQTLAESGELGELVSMRGLYGRTGGDKGILIHQGIHMLDLMHMFAGPIEEVKSIIDDSVWTGAGLEDNIMALLRTNAGVMAMLHASTTQWRQSFRLEIGFTQGYIWLDGLLSASGDYGPEMLITGRLQRDGNGQPIANPNEQIQEFKTDTSEASNIAEFIDAISGINTIQTGTSQQVFDAMNAVQRIYAADRLLPQS